MSFRNDCDSIVDFAIGQNLPDESVKRTLMKYEFDSEKLVLVAIGKAAWSMANAASDCLGDKIHSGVVITKYKHSKGDIANFDIYEAGHPVPDENSFAATEAAIALVKGLCEHDAVLLLISGGGSALFESPLLPKEELFDITKQLLAKGADIVEINTIRKRLSAVKGGKFAELCKPANVYAVVLSDIVGDPLDMIASGPAFPDSSTCEDAANIVRKYGLKLSSRAQELLEIETPKELHEVKSEIIGSVKLLCEAAAKQCEALGYEAIILSDCLACEASEAGSFLASIAKTYVNSEKSRAFIVGGETVVHVKGNGLGGRNQEFALSAAREIAGLANVALFSVGSDGTDGPCDAAGGYVDGMTIQKLKDGGIDIYEALGNNDSYNVLEKVGGLIITGATGTNVNDVAVALIRAK